MTTTEPPRPSIVVVGSVNIDLMLSVPALPRPGETVMGSGFVTAPGGKGANQAVAASRLDGNVSFIGSIGVDAFGAQARASLVASGVQLEHLHEVRGSATGVAMVLSDAAGENCIALDAGANAQLSASHVDAAEAVIAQARLLICQLETPLGTVLRALGLAKRHGVATLLNPAPAQALPDSAFKGLTFLVPNAPEASLLTGVDVVDVASAEQAARVLLAKGVGTVLLTLGAAGVLLACADEVAHFPAPEVIAVDTTGAGDTFVGAFSAAWSRGEPVRAAIAFAQRAAAFSVQQRGAQASMPWVSELPGSALP